MSTWKEALSGRSLVVASNRGPVSFQPGESGEPIPTRGAGGLVSALTEVMKEASGRWVACALTPGDVKMARQHPDGRLTAEVGDTKLNLRYLVFEDSLLDGYYNRVSNAILWFMNHQMWNLPVSPSFDARTTEDWQAYQQVNRAFAEAVAEEIAGRESTARVMLQDYHLSLVARYLKQLVPQAFSYHFTHTPWAQPATMEVLPGTMATDVLEGMLANDLLGFHSPRWTASFMWCCRQLLDARVDFEKAQVAHRGRTTTVRAYPIPIDAGAVRAAAWSPSSAGYLDWLDDLLRGRRLVLRIDRFELSKNVLRGFAGFAQMLRDHPELEGEVVHLALLYPSRQALSAYRGYEAQAVQLAKEINDELGTADWQPIVLISEANYVRAITSCRRYDVLMVNPISDGMNLVAKEGPAVNEVDGVVVLSRTAGAWDEMEPGVLGVNPYDVQELADSLHRGLTMEKSRRTRWAERNRQVVTQRTPGDWVLEQLQDIEGLSP